MLFAALFQPPAAHLIVFLHISVLEVEIFSIMETYYPYIVVDANGGEFAPSHAAPLSEPSSSPVQAPPRANRFYLARIILLFIATGCHFVSAAFVLVELSTRILPNSLEYFRSKVMNGTLLTLDFVVLALLVGWSILQLLIAYRLSGKNVVKATALCWIVTCVEALYLVLFVYGLYGSDPNGDPYLRFPAASVLFTLLVGWQFVYSVVVSTFIGTHFRSLRSSRGLFCQRSQPTYEIIV